MSAKQIRSDRDRTQVSAEYSPLMFVRDAWYKDKPDKEYVERQRYIRRWYPDLVHIVTAPPYPQNVKVLLDCWQEMGENRRETVAVVHSELFERIEWLSCRQLGKKTSKHKHNHKTIEKAYALSYIGRPK